jgi:predicted ATPase/DNA-binding SARP family transcriptional activator/Flp pilus assembly protein TadD
MLKATLLGQFLVCVGDKTVDLSARPAQLLLAYLLLYPGVAHRRDQLAGLLWPGFLDRSARKNLRNTVWQVRRALGPRFLRSDNATVAFNIEAQHDSDVARLERATSLDSTEALVSAAIAYQGDLLPGYYDDWVLIERERLRGLFERCMPMLLDRLGAEERWPEAQKWAEHWIAKAQAPEPAYRSLMLAAAARDDAAGVAAAYHRCLRALKSQLNVAPSAETDDLFQRLSSGKRRPYEGAAQAHATPSIRSPTATGGPSVLDEQQQRKRMLERTHEVAARASSGSAWEDEVRGVHPASVSSEDSLPLPPTPFFGRDRELGELRQLLGDPAHRLVTILGPGGIGKTRLGLETLAAARGRFQHGGIFVPLAALASPDHLISALAEHLALRLAPVGTPKQQLLNYLRPRRILLLLDNFEHLLDGAGLVAEILAAAPEVKFLATSRERLNLSGELVYSLGGIEAPGSASDPRLLEYGAVQMFLHRTRLLRPDLDLAAYDLEAIVRICHLVQGMPLALVLASSWLEVLSFREIASEIVQSLDFLEGQLRDMPARQRSVRATFDYSWKRLSPAQQQTFARVSVFRGGFTRQAAEAVAGTDLRALLHLMNKSFISVGYGQRYHIHELLRQYGIERLLQSGEAGEVHTRHLSYFLGLAEEADAAMRGPEQGEWLDQFEIEHDNLRAALEWALSTQRAEAGLRLAGALWWLWDNRGYHTEGRRWAEAALRLADEVEPAAPAKSPGTPTPARLPRARALLALGILAWQQGDHEPARAYLTECVALAERAGDRWCQAYGLCRLGRVLNRLGDRPGGRAHAEQSLALFRELGDPWGTSRPLRDLGLLALAEGDLEAARTALQEALAQRRALGDRDGVGDALQVLGNIRWAAGHADQAAAFYAEALSVFRELSFPLTASEALIGLGFATLDLGRLDQAAVWLREALTIATQLGTQVEIATSLLGWAGLALAGDDPERAAFILEATCALYAPLDAFLPPLFWPWRDRLAGDLLTRLGDARLAALRTRAQAITHEQLVALVLPA